MLIYSAAASGTNRNVPKQVEEEGEKARPSRKRSARDSKSRMTMLPLSPSSSAATSNKCSAKRDLVSGAIIFFCALLMMLLVGCDGAIHNQSSLDSSPPMPTASSAPALELRKAGDRRVGRAPLAAAGRSFGSRISEMFALLGPRRVEPSMAAQESAPAITVHLFGAEQVPARDEKLVGSEAHKGPPVYRSAPKQIIEIHEELAPKKKLGSEAPKVSQKEKKEATKQSSDLHSAAGFHQPKHRLGARRKSHAYPAHYTYFGKYHEHRSVPAKGAWKFGYKRGNSKHTIEREEHGHKSHFKTEVKWKDKKGKGHHVFDYNHSGHKHKHSPKLKHKKHYAAAASRVTQSKLQPADGGAAAQPKSPASAR